MRPPYSQTLPLRARARNALSVATHNLAIQDGAALLFHAYLLMRAFAAPDSLDAHLARGDTLALFVITASTVLLCRGEILPPGRARALVYRLGLFVPILLSYFEMRHLLPALQVELFDERLRAIDDLLLGVTPSVWLARFDHRPTVEWLSFFYYAYFYLLSAILLPPLFLGSGRRLVELMTGAFVVAAVGHSLYTLVPGAGPYATIHFAEPIDGGFWWRQVVATVDAAGAHLDIFPSLHTAYPLFFAMHAFGHRDRGVFRYTWPFLAFFAANIIVATMFLRWHWFADVLAGVCLAVVARQLSVAVANLEDQRALREPRQPVWEPLFR
ncbi:MAG: phosphatase PAP2 family protein [Myxococcales bacterium]|nr:phosphatase PAP2 family protein [Myxococcales bacterium]